MFKTGQQVIVKSAGGRVERGVIRPCGKFYPKNDPLRGEWFIVRFEEDGAELSVHKTNLTAVR